MREDIVALLGMEDPEEVVTGFDRPNLSYAVRKTRLPAGAARVPLVLELLKGAAMPAVVYAHTKRHTEALARGITGSGLEGCAHLDAIGRYASLTTCRREHLLSHFGDSAARRLRVGCSGRSRASSRRATRTHPTPVSGGRGDAHPKCVRVEPHG